MTVPVLHQTAGMRQQRGTVSEDKHLAVRTAVSRCVSRGLVESAAGIARSAQVSETFFYRHESQPCDLCQQVFGSGPVSYYRAQMAQLGRARDDAADREGRVTAASTQADLANAKATIQRLRLQVRALERRLGTQEGARAQGDLSELARLTQDVDPVSGRRIQELSAQVQTLTDQLAERDEELDAVRRLNADLTRRLNSH